MPSLRSLLAYATLLSFFSSVDAAVAQPRASTEFEDVLSQEKAETGGVFSNWSLRRLLGKRQDEIIVEDSPSWRVLQNGTREDQQHVCNLLLGLPPATTEVDYTPVVTVTSTGITTITTTGTTRIILTTTETVVRDQPTIAARAANVAANAAIAQDVFTSLLMAQETTAPAPTTTNTAVNQVLQEMSTACLRLNVDPTSTVTVTFTAPAAQTTSTQYRQRIETELITRLYTTTTTVTVDQTSVSSSFGLTSNSTTGASSTGSLDATAIPSGGTTVEASGTITSALSSSGMNVSSSVTSSFTIITDPLITPVPTNTGSGRSLVIALPFICPENNGDRITNIVGDKRYEYEVRCDIAAEESSTIMTKLVAGPTECAAECSVINDVFGLDECQVAEFTPSTGSAGGVCVFSGATTDFVPSIGSVTLVHTATFGAGNESGSCSVVDNDGVQTGTINTDSLLASLSSNSVSLSTPGFVTGVTVGGTFSTRIWDNTTGLDGSVTWAYRDIWESSASWYNVYQTAWSCSDVIPRTIIGPDAAANATSVYFAVTTIINGRYYTVISGTSTTTFTKDGGVVSPTPVVALTTSDGEVFTTSYATATATTNGTQGVDTAPATSIPTGVTVVSTIVSVLGSTGAASGASGSGVEGAAQSTGAAQLTQSGATFAANGTGASGVNGASVTSGGAVGTVSSAAASSNITGGSGYGAGSQAASSGDAPLTISGGAASANATGASGVILGTGSAGVPGTTVTVTSTSEATETIVIIPTATNGSFIGTISSNQNGNGTGAGSGVVQGTGAATTLTAGGANATVSDSIAVTITDGSAGIIVIGPTPGPGASGVGNITIPGATVTGFTTGANGIETPLFAPTSGAGNFSIPSGTAVTSATGDSGVISAPPSSTPTASGNASFPSSDSTFTNSGEDRGGTFSPTPTSNATLPGTGQPSATPPPSSVNGTSGNSIYTSNGIVYTASEGERRGSYSRTPSGTGSVSIPGFTANSTALAATGVTSVPVVVVPPTGYPVLNTTLLIATGGTASLTLPVVSANSSLMVGTGTIGLPPLSTGGSANSTVIPGSGYSGAPTPSANSTFSNSDLPREGSFTRSIPANSTGYAMTGTGGINTASTGFPTPSSNVTSDGACPTATGSTVIFQTITTTTVIAVTVPVADSTCISTGNATLPSGTGTGAISFPTYTTTTTIVATDLPSPSAALFRRSGELATDAQIAAACANQDSIVFNGDFEQAQNANALYWTTSPSDNFISFRTSPTTAGPNAPSGVLSGRVLSASPGSSILLSTPVTLCPGRQYRLSASNRQGDVLAQCSLAYSIGDRTVFTASPQESWLQAPRSAFYTAGDTVSAVSVELSVMVTCAGQGGFLVGTDDAGYMVVEFDDVRLVLEG